MKLFQTHFSCCFFLHLLQPPVLSPGQMATRARSPSGYCAFIVSSSFRSLIYFTVATVIVIEKADVTETLHICLGMSVTRVKRFRLFYT